MLRVLRQVVGVPFLGVVVCAKLMPPLVVLRQTAKLLESLAGFGSVGPQFLKNSVKAVVHIGVAAQLSRKKRFHTCRESLVAIVEIAFASCCG